MKKKIILACLCIIVVISAFAQDYVQVSLKKGAQNNQVDIFLRPNFSTASDRLNAWTLAIQIPFSESAGVAARFDIDAAGLLNQATSGHNPIAVDPGPGVGIDGSFKTFAWSAGQSGNTNTSWTAGTDYKVGTITFTNSNSAPYPVSNNVRLVDMVFDPVYGGVTGNAVYAMFSANKNSVTPSDYFLASFYSVDPANNIAGDDGNGNSVLRLSSPITLPLTLLSFTATEKDCQARLNWQTADEVNTSHFDIEAGSDGRSFRSIGRVEAQGNGTGRSYQFASVQAAGNTFYRLKMVDLDGSFTYSPVRRLQINCQLAEKFNIWPNPTRGAGTLNVSVNTTYSGAAMVQVMAVDGKVAYQRNISLFAGPNTIAVPVADMAAGIYSVQVFNQQGGRIGNSQKLIVNR